MDSLTVLAVDDRARGGHVGAKSFVENALGATFRLDGALDVPNVGVLLGHLGAVEPRVKHLHRDVPNLELLGQETAHDVCGDPRHVVAVVAMELV